MEYELAGLAWMNQSSSGRRCRIRCLGLEPIDKLNRRKGESTCASSQSCNLGVVYIILEIVPISLGVGKQGKKGEEIKE